MSGASIHDDRGRRVSVLAADWRAILPFARRSADDQGRLAAAVPAEFIWRIRFGLLLCVGVFVAGIVTTRQSVMAGTLFTAWHTWAPAFQFGFVLAYPFMIGRQFRRHNRGIVNSLLRAEVCPSCGYSLGGVPPEADGCSVCPECGAAWRRGTVVSTRM